MVFGCDCCHDNNGDIGKTRVFPIDTLNYIVARDAYIQYGYSQYGHLKK